MENVLFQEDINDILNIARDEDIGIRIDKHTNNEEGFGAQVDIKSFGIEEGSIEWIHFRDIDDKKEVCINTIERLEQINELYIRAASSGSQSHEWHKGFTSIEELYREIRYPSYIEIFPLPIFSYNTLYKLRTKNISISRLRSLSYYFRIEVDRVIIWCGEKIDDDKGEITCALNYETEKTRLMEGGEFPNFGSRMPYYHKNRYIESINLEIDQEIDQRWRYKYTIKIQ